MSRNPPRLDELERLALAALLDGYARAGSVAATLDQHAAASALGQCNPAQQKLLHHVSTGAPAVAMMGGWGVGKSRGICLVAQWLAENRPGCRMGIVAKTYAELQAFIEEAVNTDATGKGLLARIGWSLVRAGTGGIRRDRLVSPVIRGRRAVIYLLHYKRPKGAALAANSIEGPDLDVIFVEECNTFRDDEVATAAWGRVRSGRPPQIVMVGKPTANAWWIRRAEEMGGVGFLAPSRHNRAYLANFDEWVAAMSPRERRENLDCIPQPPKGAIYADWEQAAAPGGNLTPAGWTPERIRGAETIVTIDFGQRFPAALVISYDAALDAWVVWSEAQPTGRVSVAALCQQLMRGIPAIGAPGVYPKHRWHDRPSGNPIELWRVVGDRAGGQVRDDPALSSAIGDVALPPAAGGLGMVMQQGVDTLWDERANVAAGIKLVQRLICNGQGRRRLLCWDRLWSWGLQSVGRGDGGEARTFASDMLGYRWTPGSNGDTPLRDEHGHSMDALRYFACVREWPVNVPLLGFRTHRREAMGPRLEPGR